MGSVIELRRKLKTMTPFRIIYNDLLENKATKFIHGVLLDIGAGSSPYRFAVDKRCDYISLDLNLKKKPTICADAHCLPFKVNSFDSILCTFLLEHLVAPWTAVKEIKRVLKPSGSAIFGLPFLCRYHADPYDFWRFTKDGLNELFREFKTIEVYEMGRVYTTIV